MCDGFESVGPAMRMTVGEHLSIVVDIRNGRGLCSQVAGQSSDVVTLHLYVWLILRMTPVLDTIEDLFSGALVLHVFPVEYVVEVPGGEVRSSIMSREAAITVQQQDDGLHRPHLHWVWEPRKKTKVSSCCPAALSYQQKQHVI